ncbi:hypothetical protein BDN67DRAFT_984835 [Paxillus ammoniavirescens]|nr:hypothetical protein BDN67DRAFT_984835 [Paxillus ammoniavirescens]
MSFDNLAFPPMHTTSNINLTRDPCGFLPWLRHIRFEANSHHCVLSFTNVTKTLDLWYWPVLENGSRVTPESLTGHRQTHKFLGPGCLCSSQSINATAFTGALIFMVSTGQHSGQWVAACTTRICKYWIFLEKIFNKAGLPLQAYSRREYGGPIPGPVAYDVDNPPTLLNTPASSPFRALTGFTLHPAASTASDLVGSGASGDHVGTGVGSPDPETPTPGSSRNTYPTTYLGKRRRVEEEFNLFIVQTAPKRQPGKINEFSMLMQLDAFNQPGLMVRQVKALLTKCQCGLIMTRRVYKEHDCVLEFDGEVIDLTGDDSDIA